MNGRQPLRTAELEQLVVKAEAVHKAALNLAMTYGVFHGINASRKEPVLNSQVAAAINTIQHDLLHLMAVRLCALCDLGRYADDASIPALERGITTAIRHQLIDDDRHWRAKIGIRAELIKDVAASIALFKRQRTALRSQEAFVKSLQHFRNKLLAHVTVGHRTDNMVSLGKLWTLTRIVLAAARHARLAFDRSDCDYLKEANTAKRCGSALAKAILAKQT